MRVSLVTYYVVLIWMVMCLAVLAQRKPYNYTHPDDVAVLLKYYNDTKCSSISLGNNTYQQLLFYGKPLRVYAFMAQVCPEYMVFDPNVCRCNVPGVFGGVPEAEEKSACTTLADISYREQTGVYKSSTFVRENGKETKVDLTALTAREGFQGRPGTARAPLRLDGVPLVVESFADNQLVDPWWASLKVLPDSNAADRAARTVLLSDDCDQKPDTKSLELVLAGGRLEVFLRFSNTSLPLLSETCAVQPAQDGWFTVKMKSESGALTVRVNDRDCFTTPHRDALLAQTKCPLYLGGSPKDASTTLIGWLDYFKFIKGPRAECSTV